MVLAEEDLACELCDKNQWLFDGELGIAYLTSYRNLSSIYPIWNS